ncbi:5-formyltetrahydrofolate cyclo-ligase-like protein [Phyllosticta capitalensis]|uniref:5-formyltetrahydrofolate cyclo-ligase n=1 Tax=Phyllosticta capitalensis TaxID=121624 RepID=A0ABR1YB10_9PEZI
MASLPLPAAKRELRRQVRKILSNISVSSATSQTLNAARALFSLPEYQAARRVSIYLSMPSGEISTAGIVHDALANGKKVFVPYTYNRSINPELKPKSIMDMVELFSTSDFDSFQSDKWGIPTPSDDSIASRRNTFGGKGRSEGVFPPAGETESGLDLIVVPGMVFDSELGRLGHGKGFYDFFFDRCAEHSTQVERPRPFLVGLALAEQVLPPDQSVPMDSTDWRLDALITGAGQVLRSK